MPINPNIALGVQQQQPVNMLGQMGQMMALRAAQQEMEGSEGVRSAFAQGAPKDPTSLLQYGRQGRETLKALNESQVKQLEATQKRINLIGAGAGAALNNPTVENFRSVVENLVRNQVYSREDADTAIATIGNDASKIPAFVTPLFRQAIDAEKQLADATSRANNAATVGASYYSTNTAAQTAANLLEFNKNRRNVIASEGGYNQTDPYGNIYRVEGYGALRGPNAAPAGSVGGGGAPALPSTAANAFVTAKPSVNAFAPTAPVSQPGAPTVANAAAIEAQQNVPRPPARAGYKYDQATGNLVKIPDEKPVWNDKAQVWMTPPTAENPQGTVTEAPAVQKAVQERTANATLKVAGYDPKTQTDEVSRLIKQSTSGLAENWANKVWSAISGTGSKGAEAIAQLETRANEMTLALAPNGSLGAGFSNEDRTFMLGKLGDVANPDKPMNVRLAAWEDVMERTARTAGVPYTKQSFGSSNASSAKTVTKTGTFNGRKVVQYSDGTTAYAD